MLETEPQLKDTYVADGQVRLIYKHYPLPSHERASQAAEAAECAARQDMFWDMKTLLFERNGEWGGVADLPTAFQDYAAELGLDPEAFLACYEGGDAAARWQQDVALGQSAQVSGTPNFFIIRLADNSGTRIPGLIEYAQWQQLLDEMLATSPDS